MSTAHGIGGFAQGFLGGLDQGQRQKARALAIEKEERAAGQEKQALDLGERISKVNPKDLAAPQQELQGPTQDGKPLMSVGGADQIDALRSEAMKLTGEARKERMEQLDDVAFRGATVYIGMANTARAQSPEKEAEMLNSASKMLGTPFAFRVGEKGVESDFGPVDEATYGMLLRYAKNPAEAFEYMRTARAEQRGEEREGRALGQKDTELELKGQALADESARGWASLFQEGQKLTVDQNQFGRKMEFYYKQLEQEGTLNDAKALYYAAGANAKADALGVAIPWEDPEKYRKAYESLSSQYADFASGSDSDSPYADPAFVEQNKEYAGRALSEHGIEALPTARRAAEMAQGYIAGDPAVMGAVSGVFRDADTKKWYLETGDGVQLPIASAVAQEFSAVRGERQRQAQAADQQGVQGMFQQTQGLTPQGGVAPPPPSPEQERSALNLGRQLAPSL